eukprot:Filipodium_phascolosomae@DN7964_c0_g1_i1.p1
MQALVSAKDEPITPFKDRVRTLYSEFGTSSLLVVGGSGDFFEVADTVVMMKCFKAIDVTTEAKRISSDALSEPKQYGLLSTNDVRPSTTRNIIPKSVAVGDKVKIDGLKAIMYGRTEIELPALEQLVEDSQVTSIAALLQRLGTGWLTKNGRKSVSELMNQVEAVLRGQEGPGGMCDLDQGIDFCCKYAHPEGHFTVPRKFELAAALNRLRTLEI